MTSFFLALFFLTLSVVNIFVGNNINIKTHKTENISQIYIWEYPSLANIVCEITMNNNHTTKDVDLENFIWIG